MLHHIQHPIYSSAKATKSLLYDIWCPNCRPRKLEKRMMTKSLMEGKKNPVSTLKTKPSSLFCLASKDFIAQSSDPLCNTGIEQTPQHSFDTIHSSSLEKSLMSYQNLLTPHPALLHRDSFPQKDKGAFPKLG